MVENRPREKQQINSYISSLSQCFSVTLPKEMPSSAHIEEIEGEILDSSLPDTVNNSLVGDIESESENTTSNPQTDTAREIFGTHSSHRELIPIGVINGRMEYEPEFDTIGEAWEEYFRRKREGIPVTGVSSKNWGDPDFVSWNFKKLVRESEENLQRQRNNDNHPGPSSLLDPNVPRVPDQSITSVLSNQTRKPDTPPSSPTESEKFVDAV